MKILFVHQNFPGQFKYLAPALLNKGHDVYVLTKDSDSEDKNDTNKDGIIIFYYQTTRVSTQNIHPWVTDFETKTIRADACYSKALNLKKELNFNPDLIISHPGWGESMFLKNVWPDSKLAIYCEFFYKSINADVGFDKEFDVDNYGQDNRIQLKNLNNIIHFQFADAALSPTMWQASTFPSYFRKKITVIHDGIDTDNLRPNSQSKLILNNQIELSYGDEIITFVNRNLEPYRGYHVFMRALPKLLQAKSKCRILIVGGDDVSYGVRPMNGKKWKDIFYDEIKSNLTLEQRSRIHFLGNISYENFILMLQISKVHVYLTYPFVLSWSLLEAMSVGCSIVASNTQPLHEVINSEENGVVIDFFDSNNLSNQIIRLLDNADIRDKLSFNARETILKNYSLKDCIRKQLDWVETVLKSP